MGCGSFGWVVGLVLLGQGPADVHACNARDFAIPIQVAPADRARLKEILLYVSADEGKTWTQTVAVTPDKDQFTFHAPQDGLFWFTVQTVETTGRKAPADPAAAAPLLKVRVQTGMPEVVTVPPHQPPEEEIAALKKRVAELEKRLDQLEKARKRRR